MSDRKRRTGANRASANGRKRQGMGRRTGAAIPRSLGIGDGLLKRMTYPSAMNSNGAGSVVVSATLTSGLVQSEPATEWASFAARYQQYRVRSIKLSYTPTFTVNTGLTATTGGSQLFVSDFIGTSVPGSALQVLSDEGVKIFSTLKSFQFMTNGRRNPNAGLWNPTSAVIPGANVFGIAFASNPTTPTLPFTVTIGLLVFEWVVEFRGSQ